MAVLREILAQHQKNQEADALPMKASHPHLAREAHDARRAWRRGRALTRNMEDNDWGSDSFTVAEQELVAKFQSGALETSMIQRNKQYGHGRGVHRGLGLDVIIIIEYHLRDTTDAMESYFNQCD